MSAPAADRARVEMPAVIPLAEVEAELARRLKLAQGVGNAPIQRARMSNLIIHCDSAERAREVEAVIPAIVSFHPARVLLLVADDHSGSREISASVIVRKAGADAQLCSEQVTLWGGRLAADHLPFAVRELVIGDLPTNVWWANNSAPSIAGPILADLAENAQQVIFDSLGWLDPHRGVAQTSGWLAKFERGVGDGRWRVASDLNWRRLKFWRRLIAQAFDPAGMPGALDSVREIVIEHGPHAVTQAWQLVGWMASRLGWEIQATTYRDNVEIAFRIAAAHGSLLLRIVRFPDGPSEVRKIRISCTIDGQPATLAFATEGHRLSVTPEGVEGTARTITAQPLTTAEIVGRQLSDREPDPVFREAMLAATILARAVIH